MKILDLTFKRKVNCSASVCLWNHWDHDHINYTHEGIYDNSQIYYEDDRSVLFFHNYASSSSWKSKSRHLSR